MKFHKLACIFEKIEKTKSRLEITGILASLFNDLDKDEIKKAVYLLSGRIAPIFEKPEFGIAEKLIIKSICYALNLDRSYFTNKYRQTGDIGLTVSYFKNQTISFESKDLSISQVFADLFELAQEKGEGSQEGKMHILANLIRLLDPLSVQYLVRIPIGLMRMGFSDMTVLDALSWMKTGDKSLRAMLEKAYQVRPDLGYIAEVMKEQGIDGIKKIRPRLFSPILMMRAERLSSAKEIINQIGKCIVEPKYDGFRLQIHYKKSHDNNTVRLYSRNLEEVSFMYPDIIEGVKNEIRMQEAIFEGEAIGFDPLTGNFLPFQETVQRKRKYGIKEKAKEVPLKLFVFELLYLNGKNLISIPFEERRKKMTDLFKLTDNIFQDTVLISPEHLVSNEKQLDLLFDDAISKGLEGIIAKKLEGTYQPGARGWNWIKFKRSYSSKIEDTIDCIVMGYDFGKGKRTGFGIGAFLVGIYDEIKDKYLTVAKIGTGLSDVEWIELKKMANKYATKIKPAIYDVDKQMNVDVWMKPNIVVEIRADEITKSPVHTAGRSLKISSSGNATEIDTPRYALRFPRLVRFRKDKRTDDSSHLSEIESMYNKQAK